MTDHGLGLTTVEVEHAHWNFTHRQPIRLTRPDGPLNVEPPVLDEARTGLGTIPPCSSVTASPTPGTPSGRRKGSIGAAYRASVSSVGARGLTGAMPR
jgi:hypothetical protein